METVDAAAVRPLGAPEGGSGPTLFAELVARAGAVGLGEQARGSRSALPTPELAGALQECERRARRMPAALAEAAALDFLGDAIAASTSAGHAVEPGEMRAAVVAAADLLGVPGDAAAFVVFRRALASKECVRLPPAAAAGLAVALLAELAPAAAAALWALDAGGAASCIAGCGETPQARALREAARAALHGLVAGTGSIRVQVVDRRDRPYAALVARAPDARPGDLDDYLAEAASALGPILERAADVDRKLESEREVAAAGARRLVRLGFDLHDGPLQEIVALADELRMAAVQIEGVVADDDKPRVRGRFHDLHARLASLDGSLRGIARATRSIAAVARPVEEAVERELQALERAAAIETELRVDGDLAGLTDSQKIVLFRVVQEALSNVRKHSGARRVSVVVRSTRTFLELTISDDGCGFDAGTAGDRLGLAGIAERVRLLGGDVRIDSRPGAGARVRATLPQWRPSTRTPDTLPAAEA